MEVLTSLLPVGTTALEDGLMYACVGLGVWLSYRVLAFPDLTVDSSFTLGAAVSAVLLVKGMSPALATTGSICAGLCAGTFTGLLATKLHINPLLAGILTMTALYSINLSVMGGSNVPLLNQTTAFDGVRTWIGLADRHISGMLLTGTVVIVVGALLTWFLHTQFGLAVRATGDNEHMIRGLGVDTDFTKILALALANGIVALSGSLVGQDNGFADVGMGIGMIIAGLAAIILGEVLFRRRGVGWAIAAVVLGTLVYRLIITASLRAGLGPNNLKLVTAGLVILVLAAPQLQTMLPGRRRPIGSRGTPHAQHTVAEQDVLLGHG
jgi:putative tryptophan/tyrosine transport system permease protein